MQASAGWRLQCLPCGEDSSGGCKLRGRTDGDALAAGSGAAPCTPCGHRQSLRRFCKARITVAVPFDVLIVPGGSAAVDARLLGQAGLEAIRDFVRRGGGYCGVCAGAFLALRYENAENALALVDGTARLHDGRLRSNLDEDVSKKDADAAAPERNEQALDVRLTAEGRRLLWDEGKSEAKEPLENARGTVRMRYSNGPQIVLHPGSDAVVLGTSWPVSTARHSVHRSLAGSAAILARDYHDGRAVLISPHAESTHDSQGGSRAEPGKARLRRILQRAVLLSAAGAKEHRWLEGLCCTPA
eukprot:TRINITY_DN27521_c0_g1_i1.p1 TRINITY_DN27521_c0_g1~~TRINITY_DN27521_c0_g1_i1.p1  ORF type:complete len:300 (-),score=57.87 TRINITY_DN27521_c0_g1_i1:81-980(-)